MDEWIKESSPDLNSSQQFFSQIFLFSPHSEGQREFHDEWRGVSLHPVSSIHAAERLISQRSVSPSMKWMVRG